jgi:hypothetical protein
MVGYVLHIEGVGWRHGAIYSQYQNHMHVVTLVSAVEKSLNAAGTRTPVPRLCTLLSISHCTD